MSKTKKTPSINLRYFLMSFLFSSAYSHGYTIELFPYDRFNFGDFYGWPNNTFSNDKNKFASCVYGSDSFINSLDINHAAKSKKPEHNQTTTIKQAKTAS